MKFAQAISFLFSILLLSCGDSNDHIPAPKDTGENNDPISTRLEVADAPSLPKKIISKDGWVGSVYDYKGDFIEVFEDREIARTPPPGAGPEYKVKRDENDTGLIPLNMGRLRNRNDNSPYTGKVYQHFLSGELEHFANYQDGFRKGIAYWWKKDGNLTKASEGWGYDYKEISITEELENPIAQITQQMTNIDPSVAGTAIFVGFQNEWEDWSAVNSDGITFSLSSGVYLTGEVKIFSEDGDLQTIRRYKDGLLDGEMATYHPNGKQAQSVQYKAGKRHGKEIWWQDNGYKSYSANHVAGKLHGKTFNWDDKGYLVSQSEFDMGNPVRPTEKVSTPAPQVEQ